MGTENKDQGPVKGYLTNGYLSHHMLKYYR
jgi:hypothetical protein